MRPQTIWTNVECPDGCAGNRESMALHNYMIPNNDTRLIFFVTFIIIIDILLY